MQVTDEGIILNDNRIAVPEALQKAVLNHLHKNHPGQLAMIDAASYMWWPKMNRSIIEKAEKCERCTEYGKNLKTLQGKQHNASLPALHSPNEEVQLDFAGPLFDRPIL